jgi:hypothetical protein
VTGGDPEVEGRGVGVDVRVQFEERLVNAAQFLGAEVAVVDPPTDLVLEGEGERSDCFEEVGVGQLGAVEVGGGPVAPEE